MNLPVTVKRARLFTMISAGIWLVLGVVRLMLMGSVPDETYRLALTVALMMLGNGLVLGFSGFMLFNRKQTWFYMAFFVLATNIFLTVTDQFGLLDFLTLIVDCIAMVFLIRSWVWYKGEADEEVEV